MMYTKICTQCRQEFTTTTQQRRRCTQDCGRTRHGVKRTDNRVGRKDTRRGRPERSLYYDGREFIGVDGEGVTDPDGNHRYVMLSVGTETLKCTEPGGRLGLLEIFTFLWEQYEAHPNAIFSGFYLTYDFAQWFRGLTENRAIMLFTAYGRAKRAATSPHRHGMPFPVEFMGWEFDFLGMRRLKLRPAGDTRWMYINDTGPFWQTSFMNAIDPKNWGDTIIVNSREWAILKEGKANRATAQLDADMIKYNTLENDVLARIMSTLERGFSAVGVNLSRSQFYGPGQAAQAWMNNVSAPTAEQVREVTPVEVLDAAQATYYGGWFEIPRHGHIEGTSYEYDINSAYPHIISELPCLLHGTWERGRSDGALTLVHVTTRGSDAYLGGLPHRDNHGIISRPHSTRGWYWWHEVVSSIRAGLIDTFEVHDSWTYLACGCRPPLRGIRGLYDHRLKVGKNTPEGKAIKLLINSVYGKHAQSIGSPKYSNPIAASLITAGCRTMILDAIATHPDKSKAVLMVATDGIYFRTPHPSLDISPEELGKWDEGYKENLTLFMPGVYWDDSSRVALADGRSPKLKSRGINASELAGKIEEVDATWDTCPPQEWPEVTVPVRFSVISPALALARGKWGTCGTIQTYDLHGTTKVLSSDPSNKRDVSTVRVEEGMITTSPYEDKGESVPYDKTFGMDLQAALDNDALITDDGLINRELVELLGG